MTRLLNTLLIAALTVGAFTFVAPASACKTCDAHAGDKSKAPSMDIVDTAAKAGKFNTLVAAVKAAGLVDTLKSDGPLTVFAPTDEAFAKLPEGTVESLLKPENKDKLVAILTYHVVPGEMTAKKVLSQSTLKTVQGQALKVALHDGKPHVDEAHIVAADIMTTNGVIHVIDTVVIPEG
ncbi:fasciclin domain-containing protein [Planctomycetales bacterium ZRK34]|nr:fasciclin domain-containing protein [Planctomycetales bacterium ZRK34]